MRNLFAAAAAATTFAGYAAAAPLSPRQLINDNGTAAFPVGDVNILNFALTLEYLEVNLYETVVTTYSDQDFVNNGFTAADRATFNQIISQELQHIAALQKNVKMLGGQVIQPCKYNYGKATSLKQLLNATDAVNGLGPSAYLGAGAFVTSKLLLTQGASIGNIETRHNSWLNGLIGRSEQPTTFQLPLSPTQAYGVGSQFIVNGTCPASNSGLLGAVLAFPPSLTITNSGYPAAPLEAGATLYLKAGGGVTAPRAAFLYGFSTTIVPFDASTGTAKIPDDFAGQGYVVLTTATQGQLLDNYNSVTVPQALYVDNPAQKYSGNKYSTYQFA